MNFKTKTNPSGEDLADHNPAVAFLSLATATFCILAVVAIVSASLEPMYEDSDSGSMRVRYNMDWEYVMVDYPEIREYGPMHRQSTFMLLAHRYITTGDPVMTRLYDVMGPALDGLDDYGKADYLRTFVQHNIVYVSDEDNQGFRDYIQYPSETVISKRGDCEDHAVLLYTLYVMAGLDAVFVKAPDHVYVAVAVDAEGEYVQAPLSDKRYYTVEPTTISGIGGYKHDEAQHTVFHATGWLVDEGMLVFALLALVCVKNWCDVVTPYRPRTLVRPAVSGETE